jgi:hypothetical protein
MEQQSNTVSVTSVLTNNDELHKNNVTLSYNVEQIIENLFNGNKPVNLSVEQFLELIDNESNNSICWKILTLPSEKKIYLFSNEWNIPNNIAQQNFSVKYFNNLVIDSDLNILMYGGSKIFDSNRDKCNLDQIKKHYSIQNSNFNNIYEAYEGTSINVFYENELNKWMYCTKKKFNMFESCFGSSSSHGAMFEDIISTHELETKLNKNYTYNFVLVHNNNSHIIKENVENKLVLIAVRDRENSHKQINIFDSENVRSIIEFNNVILPKIVSLDEFESWNQSENIVSQGIILHYNDNIFRVYTTSYQNQLKANPKFHTTQEKLFWAFQNNKLNNYVDNDNYAITLSAINYVAIMLFRMLTYFTKFKKNFTEDEKFIYGTFSFIPKNNEQYEKLQYNNALKRNIYKLQRLPFAVKNIEGVDFDQVKHHIKYHCSAQDIYGMYLTFIKNPDFEQMVKYKSSPEQKLLITSFSNVTTNA